jgi:hypothetical protein
MKDRLSVGWVAAVLAGLRARTYVVLPPGCDSLEREACGRTCDTLGVARAWCLTAGWPLVTVERFGLPGKPKYRVRLDLPAWRWLTPEGHSRVEEYLHGLFAWKGPPEPPLDAFGLYLDVTGFFTHTNNSDPLPCCYAQRCRGRDVHAAAAGLFSLASRHFEPDVRKVGLSWQP